MILGQGDIFGKSELDRAQVNINEKVSVMLCVERYFIKCNI